MSSAEQEYRVCVGWQFRACAGNRTSSIAYARRRTSTRSRLAGYTYRLRPASETQEDYRITRRTRRCSRFLRLRFFSLFPFFAFLLPLLVSPPPSRVRHVLCQQTVSIGRLQELRVGAGVAEAFIVVAHKPRTDRPRTCGLVSPRHTAALQRSCLAAAQVSRFFFLSPSSLRVECFSLFFFFRRTPVVFFRGAFRRRERRSTHRRGVNYRAVVGP